MEHQKITHKMQGTTPGGSHYEITPNRSHAISGQRPDGEGGYLSTYGPRNLGADEVIDSLEYLESLGWTSLYAYEVTF